ncbi:hypothetical protein H8A97_12945 [Bradyrhizobium sp. Arg62]|uniref:hypothetical protein n=1 Tax=Bradyrhizobium brasilense TaxID=1419277 RepID=UPI001E593B9E|nr:hypothetical protein [Bradyrhizobium brasilense]MCC8945980.1 hypothetical protein [Bradyrhizobium brasilense]
MSARRADLVQAYTAALETAPLLVLAVAGKQPSRIAYQSVKNLDIVETYWFAKVQHVELVVHRCRDDLADIGALRSDGWIDLPAVEVCEVVTRNARLLGAPIRSMDQVRGEAEKAVERIVANVEMARIQGKLRTVNAEYKAYRQRELAANRKPISYSAHLAQFTLSLVLLAAQNANAAPLARPKSPVE